MADEVVRRHRFDDFTESQQETLVAAAVPLKTKQATDFWWGVFQSFCREKGISVDVTTISAGALADILKKFYGGLRTKKGETYQATSYLSARAAIQRKLTAANRLFNLRADSEFRESNIVLDAILKNNKANGLAKQTKHKDAITDVDKDRLATYFEGVLETEDTQKLQVYCWYNLARHLGLRGTEVFVKMNKADIVFKTDENGLEYATLSGDFKTKNTPGGIGGREFQTCGRIQDPTRVSALRRLVGKLHPLQNRLFQRILYGVRPAEGPWFANVPLGHNSLADMMPKLSCWAKLSQRYTNHCVRASVVTDLKDAGFSPNEVCAVTGHKDERSLQPYDRLDRPGCDRPRAMADVLDGKRCAMKRPMSDSPTPIPSAKRLSENVLDKIVLNDQAVIHHLTISVSTATAQHHQQSLSTCASISQSADQAQNL